MKKLFAVIITLVMLIGCVSLTAFAEDQPLTANVYVTIARKGSLAVAQEKITVTDRDGNGILTVDEALYAAHETKYEGGAKAGYASAATDWGLSISKLWGDSSGNFGYYLNNASAWSLADTVKEGDYLTAFVYSDATNYSDIYCWFDVSEVSADATEEITLTLLGAGYDKEWKPVTVAVEGATVTVDGEKTSFKTDKDGKVTFTVDKEGSYIISAVSDTQTLVPPVCRVTVSAVNVTPPADENNTSNANTPDTEASGSTALTSPKTADNSSIVFFAAVMTASAAVMAVLFVMRKKFHEK